MTSEFQNQSKDLLIVINFDHDFKLINYEHKFIFDVFCFNPLNANPTKLSNTRVFDSFVGLAFKGLKRFFFIPFLNKNASRSLFCNCQICKISRLQDFRDDGCTTE